MTCREVTEFFIDFVSGELPAEVELHLRKHLEECPPCVTYLETYQITIRLTRQLPDEPPPKGLLDRLKAALEKHRDEPSGR